jgi:hypothetical protein
MFLFVAFIAGFQGFQNYSGNFYFWLLSGVVFALPTAAGSELNAPEREIESARFQ